MDQSDVLVATTDDAPNKRSLIQTACENGDIIALISLADSENGLLDDTSRVTAWPILLGCVQHGEQPSDNPSWEKLREHSDEEQVQKDVDRAFVYYPENESLQSREHNKTALHNLIIHVLRKNPMLHYFQGYHDIAQVFLLVLGPNLAYEAVTRVSLFRIRDYMLPTMAPAEKHLHLIPAILKATDLELAQRLNRTPPHFALSAVLTLYAHDMQKYADIARLYDFILAHEPIMSIYLFAALIISRREELLAIPDDEPDMLLFKASKLPQPLNIQSLINSCLEIFCTNPPNSLPGNAWRRISQYSVLKTSSGDNNNARTQSLETAHALFEKQAAQLAREELAARVLKQMHKKKWPLINTCAAVSMLVLSIYLRRNGHDRYIWTTLWRAADIFRR